MLLLALTDNRYACSHRLCSVHSPHLKLLMKAPFTLWALYIYMCFYKSFSLHNKTSTVISNVNFPINKIAWDRIVIVQSLSCVWLFDPMDCRAPGFPVLRCLPEFVQTHVYGAYDAIQPSHPLSSLSALALNLSQHQGLFQQVSSSHQVAKVLELQLQHQSFQWIFSVDFL